MYDFYVESGDAASYEPRGCRIVKKLYANDKECVYVSIHPPIDDEYYKHNAAETHLVLIPGPIPVWPKSKARDLDFYSIPDSQFPVPIDIGTISRSDITESGRIDLAKIRIIDKGSLIKSPEDRWRY